MTEKMSICFVLCYYFLSLWARNANGEIHRDETFFSGNDQNIHVFEGNIWQALDAESFQKRLEQLNVTEETKIGKIRVLISKCKRHIQYQVPEKNSEILLILRCLEYLVHDIENAREFHALESVSDIIHPILTNSSSSLRIAAVHLLITAATTCPRVQIAAVQSDVLSTLLKIVLWDSDEAIRIHSMTALSCILKSYISGQLAFINKGGLSSLTILLDQPNKNPELLVKVLSLLQDIFLEHRHVIKQMSKTKKGEKKLFTEFGLEETIQDYRWCSKILQVLPNQQIIKNQTIEEEILKSRETLPEKSVHVLVEKIFDTLLTLFTICRDYIVKLELKKTVLNWKSFYNELATQENEFKVNGSNPKLKEYYIHIIQILNRLEQELESLNKRVEL